MRDKKESYNLYYGISSILSILRHNCKLYNKVDNLEEIDKSFCVYHLPRLNYEEIKKSYRSLYSKDVIIKISPARRPWDMMASLPNSTKYLKKINIFSTFQKN